MIQRCRDLLRVLGVSTSLDEAAVNHVLRPKNLRLWGRVRNPPLDTFFFLTASKNKGTKRQESESGEGGESPMHRVSPSSMPDYKLPLHT